MCVYEFGQNLSWNNGYRGKERSRVQVVCLMPVGCAGLVDLIGFDLILM